MNYYMDGGPADGEVRAISEEALTGRILMVHEERPEDGAIRAGRYVRRGFKHRLPALVFQGWSDWTPSIGGGES